MKKMRVLKQTRKDGTHTNCLCLLRETLLADYFCLEVYDRYVLQGTADVCLTWQSASSATLQKVSQIDSEDGQTWRTHVHSGVDKHFQVLFTQPDKRRGNDFAQKHKYWRISDPFLLSVLGKEIWEWKHTTGEGTDSPSDSKLQSSNTNTNTSNAIPWKKRNCPSRMLRHGIRSDAKWKFATLTIKKKTM